MSDVTSNEPRAGETDYNCLSIGEQLRTAREKNKLDIEEVAQELHLDVDVVQALESGERENLPAQIFVQGYLKSYARLVGLPADELLKDFIEQAGEPPPLTVYAPTSRLPSVRLRSLKLVRNIVIVLLVALVLWMIWPLAERIIESQRETSTEQAPGRLELPPVSGNSGNDP